MLLVLLFEWLTLLATRRCLPQTSQCAAISNPSGRRVPLALADGNRKQAPGRTRTIGGGPPLSAPVPAAAGVPVPPGPAHGRSGRGRPTGGDGLAARRGLRP